MSDHNALESTQVNETLVNEQVLRGEQAGFESNEQSVSLLSTRKEAESRVVAMKWGRREEAASEKKTLKSFARFLGKVCAPQFTTQSPPFGFGGPLDPPFLLLHHCQVKS